MTPALLVRRDGSGALFELIRDDACFVEIPQMRLGERSKEQAFPFRRVTRARGLCKLGALESLGSAARFQIDAAHGVMTISTETIRLPEHADGAVESSLAALSSFEASTQALHVRRSTWPN